MFIAPVSRYVILLGKIIGESLVAIVQLIGLAVMAVLFQISFSWQQMFGILGAVPMVALLGGSFGLLVM